MKKVLVLGDNGETCELLERAKKLNIYTIVTDYNPPEYSSAKRISDEYWMISTGDLDALEKKCLEENIDAVISGASDFNIKMSILLAERLGLPSYCNEATWNAVTDKIIFKQLARDAGVPVPADYTVTKDLTSKELESVVFPVMVKPVDLCSNAGISYCYTKNELINAYRYARSLTRREEIIVEQMLTGKEFFAYYVLAEGKAVFFTLGLRLSQPGEPRCCYSMNTSINSFTDRYLREMDASVVELLKRIGCREGIACVQCMMDSMENFYAIEMCYSAEASILLEPLNNVCDFDGITWQLECALGETHSKKQLLQINKHIFDRCANSLILYANKEGVVVELNGFDTISKYSNMRIKLYVHLGDVIHKYYPLGTIMFDTDDCEQACRMLEVINETVHIKNTLGEDVLIYFSDYDSLRKEYQGLHS